MQYYLTSHTWHVTIALRINIKNIHEKYSSAKEGINISSGPVLSNLFFETIKKIQDQLREFFFDMCQRKPTKEGFAKAMKEAF